MYTSLSDNIRNCRSGVVANPYQGKDKKVVFVCSMGILRSATAARLYASKYNTRCAGTWDDALIPLSETLIEWADELVFVNKENQAQALRNFADNEWLFTKIGEAKVLHIPDNYEHMHPKLIEAFKEQYEAI
jgi:predicted protein tyrosine phosphatase